MKEVIEVLRALGYDEIRLQGGSWQPISEADGTLGTTGETYVIQGDEPPRIRLRDPETGKEIGRARKEAPEQSGSSGPEKPPTTEETREE